MADETPASRPAQGREIVLPIEPIRAPPQPLGNQNWKLALAVLGSGLASVLGGAFSNYLQARGFVSVGAARIFLGMSLLAGIVLIVVAVMAFATKGRAVKITLGILVLLVSLGGFETWAIINGPKRIEAVTVDPQHLSFDGSLPKETYSLFVRENAGTEAYSVQVKMKFAQKSSSDFTFDTPSPRPIMEGSPLTDIQGLRCSDHNGHAVVMFWIYRMEPHSTREMSITHNSDSTATIDSKITYFTPNPVPRTGDKIHATGTFHFDEPLTCSGDITFQIAPTTPIAPSPTSSPTSGTPPAPALADLELAFVQSNGLAVIAKNKPQVAVAKDPKYLVSFWNLDEIGAYQGLPAFGRTDSGGFIKPGEFGFGPSQVFDFVGPNARYTVGRIKQGDRLFGFATMTCSNCLKTACYWIFDTYGVRGWYSARKDPTEQDCMRAYGAMLQKVKTSPNDLLLAVPETSRVPIKRELTQ